MAQHGAKPSSGGSLAPKARDEDHCTDGRNWSGDTPTPSLKILLTSINPISGNRVIYGHSESEVTYS